MEGIHLSLTWLQCYAGLSQHVFDVLDYRNSNISAIQCYIQSVGSSFFYNIMIVLMIVALIYL